MAAPKRPARKAKGQDTGPIPPKRAPKGPEQRERIRWVQDEIVRGKDRRQLLWEIQAKYNIGRCHARKYIITADKWIGELHARRRDDVIAEQIAIRKDIRRRAREIGDLRLELEAAREEAKMYGVDPSSSTSVNVHATHVNTVNLSHLNDDQLRQIERILTAAGPATVPPAILPGGRPG